jgi:hypothetical protein
MLLIVCDVNNTLTLVDSIYLPFSWQPTMQLYPDSLIELDG